MKNIEKIPGMLEYRGKPGRVLSGSSMERRIECPGSWHAEKNRPPINTGASLRGSFMHRYMEYLISNRGRNDPELAKLENTWRELGEWTGERLEFLESWDDMDARVQVMFETFRKYAASLEVYLEDIRNAGARKFLEVGLHWEDDMNMGGTADFIHYNPGANRLLIMDWKFGNWPVKAMDNKQLILYAVCALWGKPVPALREMSERDVASLDVRLCVVQKGEVREWKVMSGELLRWSYRIDALHEACRKEDAPRKRGSHCYFCKARRDCPVCVWFKGE